MSIAIGNRIKRLEDRLAELEKGISGLAGMVEEYDDRITAIEAKLEEVPRRNTRKRVVDEEVS